MKLQETNFIRTFNVGLIVIMLLLFAVGVMTLVSATRGPGLSSLYRLQLIWFGVGLVVGTLLVFLDIQTLEKVAYPIYFICLVMLGLVLIFGKIDKIEQRGNRIYIIDFKTGSVTDDKIAPSKKSNVTLNEALLNKNKRHLH